MKYFLDTDTCIFALRQADSPVRNHLQANRPEDVVVPAIVKAELLLGAAKSTSPRKAAKAVTQLLLPLTVVPFCEEAAVAYAKLRCKLETRGTLIGPNDLIIAATVLAHGGTLVTHNTREFKRVAGLKLVDWTV